MKIRFLKAIFIIVLLSLNTLGLAREYRVYDFQALSEKLGYPSVNYFNSSEEEIGDLETYASKEDSYYKEINNFLRFFPAPYDWNGISPETARKMVTNIDAIFYRVPNLPDDLILFRGVDLNYRKSKSFEVGEEFVEKGYASTSTSFKIADYFATVMNDQSKSRKAIFVLFQNKKNDKGILFDQGEDEVLLKHDEKIKIMARDLKNRQYDLYFAQRCDVTCDSNLSEDAKKFWGNFQLNQMN